MRKILLLLFAVLLTAVSAYSFTSGGIYYNITSSTDKTVEVTYTIGYNTYSGSVSIPQTVSNNGTTYRVTAIGTMAFRECTNLTGVTIPSSVTSIGEEAFYKCTSLPRVTIPNSVTFIGINAFLSCSNLTSVDISNSLTSIPANAFACTSLTSVTIPNSVTTIDQGAFSQCYSLTSVVIGSGVTSIGYNVFGNNTTITYIECKGNTPPTIDSSTFTSSHYSNATLKVPRNFESTYRSAEYWSNFTDIVSYDIEKNGIYYLITSEENKTVEVTYKDNSYNSYSGSITIPSTVQHNNKTYRVTTIDNYAFYGCSGLTSVTIPSSVTTIESWAFRDCSSLTSVVIPNSVTTIGQVAFYNCPQLSSVVIGSGVTSIGIAAFNYCTALTSITCWAETPPSIDSSTFGGNQYSNAQLYVPVGKKSAYQAANGWANFTNMHELEADFVHNGIYYRITGTSPATVKVTYRDSEHNSYSGNVTIPSTVTYGGTTYTVNEVGRWSFYDCVGLTSVTIPSSVTYIDDYAFENCTGLTSITIPSSVTAIGHEVFASCTGLTSLTIPSSVTYLGEAAFGMCTGLTSVTVPASVTDMGAAPFAGCDGLTTLKVASGNPVYSSPNNCNAIIRTSDHALINGCNTTVIPNNVTAIEAGAFVMLPSLTSIAIPSSVTTIGESAFARCTGLTSVVLPPSVTSIGHYAFGECTGLTSMTLPSSVTTIGEAAFQGCTDLTSVTLPSSLTTIGGNAFQWCNLMNLTCLAQTPPVLANNAVFDWDTYNNATLYVPSASVSAYQAAFGWSNFAHVTVYIEPEAYACYTPSNTTLTFYYDNQRSSREGTTYNLNTGDSSPGWYLDQTYKNVTTAVFDPSFAGARPTSTSRWFGYMDNLTSITGISNLNTSEVTNMKMMFYHCSNLASLDVSGFNTANVADMYGMFYYCGALTSLDVSGFNTANVTKMAYMFRGCSGLTIIDVSGFNTAKVTSMSDMFYGCSGVTSLDLSGFNTESVTGMGNMFDGCSGLTTLDLSSFNTTNVTSMRYMFDGCSNLTTIYVTPDTWSNAAVLNSEYLSSGTFSGCTSLVGGAGTTYDANHVNADYAHIDGGPSNPGYLTAAGAEPWHEPEAYACYTSSNTTLTFYYDNQRSSREGTTYDLNRSNNYPRWYSDSTCRSVTKVVFNPSFADARPTSTFRWFNGMTHLTSITGISFLNTENVTNMAYMFYNCSGLTSLDVSNFNTAKVTEMGALFYGCSGLTNLDVSGFNTDRVIGMSGTFAGCSGLTSLDLSNFNTAKVTIMSNMFYNCSGLTSLDLSNFNTAKVTNMGYMFKSSRNLRTIYVGSEWNTDIVTSSTNMFLDCTSLVGGQGTTYDPDHVNKTYAHIDGGSSNPGYFTAAGAEPWHEPEAYACYTPSNTTLTFYYDNQRSTRTGTTYDLNEGMANPGWDDDNSYKSVTHVVFDPSFADARPTSTCSWFWGMTNLQTITGMDCMNTEDVTTMWGLFTSCSSLTTLDLSSFNTSRVTNMLGMFSDCSNLTTIYAGSGWSMATVSVTTNMFTNCTKLVGGQGTTYDPNHTNGFYARIDGGTSNPGYFSEKSLIQRGDVDGDGRIDINDVTMLNYVVLGQSQGTYYPEAADCDVENGDGSIDINDVTALIGRVLTGSW